MILEWNLQPVKANWCMGATENARPDIARLDSATPDKTVVLEAEHVWIEHADR